jgi:transposase
MGGSQEVVRLTPEQKEWRRQRAVALKASGWKQRDIAAALGVTEGAVSQWLRRAAEGGGAEALRRRKAPGGKFRIPRREVLSRLPELLSVEGGATSYGFIGDHWTADRVAVVIEETWGVRYHRSHVSRLLAQAGLSSQLPQLRAAQRDEAAIELFKRREWKRLKRGQDEQAGS